jgi:hypothetical protein
MVARLDYLAMARPPSKLHHLFLIFVAVAFFGNISLIYHHLANLEQTDVQPPSSPSSPVRSTSIRSTGEIPVFTICLLTKDDKDILPEWIAYHYHALRLRHLVVTVDPSSETDPQDLFARFTKELPDLTIDRWSDADFLPDFFLNQSYGQVPNFMGVELHDSQTFEYWYTSNKIGPVKKRDMTHVNNHRYRQTRFISQCSRHLLQQHPKKQVLVSTLDSDEYLVVNPWIVNQDRHEHFHTDTRPSRRHPWQTLEAGSVLEWLVDSNNATHNPCIQVPRLLFGSIETETDGATMGLVRDGTKNTTKLQSLPSRRATQPHSTYETLRWKHHAAWNDTRNFQQKVILDLREFPADDELWSDHVNSVHRPSRKLCPNETDQGHWQETALAAFHYLGSWERYNARQDLRRNKKRYRERSNLTFGVESGWIDQWLPKFVEHVGMETAANVLQNYIVADVEEKD